MKSSNLATSLLLLILTSATARAEDADCQKIMTANQATGSGGVQMKVAGYDFARDTPKLYAFGDHSCSHLRDDTLDGQPATVYREQYKASTGSTTATIWISRSSGHLLREEQDGDIAGKGKGHISYVWPAKP